MKQSVQLYARLLQYIRPYWRVVLASFGAMAVAAACQPLLPALLAPLIDNFGQAGTATLPQSGSWFLQEFTARLATDVRLIPLFIVLVAIIKGIADYIASVASQWVANKAIEDIRADVFRHQMLLPVGTHQQQTAGRMLSRITYDVAQAASALSNAWIIVIQDSLYILFLTIALLATAWELTLVILAIAPIIAWIIRKASAKMRNSSRAMQMSMAALTSSVEESLAGIKEIKIFGTHVHESNRFGQICRQLRKETMRVARVAAANVPLVQVLAATAVAIVIYVATTLSETRAFSSGQFVAYITTMALLFEPIRRLTNVNSTIQRGLAGAQSIFELLDMPAEEDRGSERPARLRGNMRLENLSFRYPGQDSWAVAQFNLDIAAGETVALVGASGSGKTTLFALAARFFEPEQGRVLVDGIDTHALALTALRQQIALVGQHAALFDDTVAANIAYGRPDVSEADIIKAARQAHAWEFIEKLPQGLRTRIGTNGNLLSGGQRQRIAIARAFLKNAPILLLDEATSALDNESERVVREALVELRKDRTVLVIAHRLSTIRDADRIVVMEHGRIVEVGKHAELAAANGPYAKLLQSGEDIVGDDASTGGPLPV